MDWLDRHLAAANCPPFFGNSDNIFWLCIFLTIPKEMHEAAQIDGAGPLRNLISVILPQSIPAIITVSLFHFSFAQRFFMQGVVINGVQK